MNKTDCIYYDEEFNCCGFETDYGQPMPVFKPCHENLCERREPRLLLEMPKRTNYDKITESVESLAEFIIFVVNESKNQRRLVSKILKDKNGKNELKKTIKEWLQKECDNDGNT